MNLAIVDIDGTLTRTSDIDAECYVRVVSAFLSHSFATDWSAYENVTDSGIVEELCREYLERSATVEEMASIESAFVSELAQASRYERDYYRREPLMDLDSQSVEVIGRGGLVEAAFAWRSRGRSASP